MVSARLTDKASDRLIDNAVDRKAAARADWVTAFLRGESSIPLGQYVYLLEYVDKMLITLGFFWCLHHHHGKIAAGQRACAGLSQGLQNRYELVP